MYTKAELRKCVRAQVRALSEEERYRLSQKLIEKLEKHPKFIQAATVMLFHSLPDEIDTHELLVRCSQSKQVLLPVVQGDDLEVRVFRGEENLISGHFGIGEPRGERFLVLQTIDLIIVPGMAFDAAGHRLGRGRGFYDRFLSQTSVRQIYKLGVCFPCQLQVNVPAEEHDVKMDEVLC